MIERRDRDLLISTLKRGVARRVLTSPAAPCGDNPERSFTWFAYAESCGPTFNSR